MKKKVKKAKQSKAASGKRVPTGVPGFDDLIQGGFPQGSSVVIAGGPGTGKTIFGVQYLYNGATKYNEKGLLVTFEQRVEDIYEQARQFGWNLQQLEKQGKIKIMAFPANKINDKTIDEIRHAITNEGIKRMVLDSVSTLIVNAPVYSRRDDLVLKDVVSEYTIFSPPIVGDYIVKKFLYTFIDSLKGLGCTCLLIAEATQSGESYSRDSLSEFAADGLILITFEALGGEFSRSLIVRKMRQTKNDEDIHPLEIGKSGIVVHEITK